MKIVIPLNEVISTGSLKDFYDDLIKVQSGLTISNDGTNVTIENGNLNLGLGEINQILTAGGEVYGYLLAIQADIALLGDDLPDGLPNRNTLNESASSEIRKFKNWFDTSAEVWKKDDNTKVYFLSNPIGTSTTKYLTGSQVALIYNSFKIASPLVINRACLVRTIAQFNSDVATGWTQINF